MSIAKSNTGIFLAVAFVAIALAGGAWLILTAREGPAQQPQFATVLPQGRPLPEFALMDHDGRPFTLDDLRGHASLVFFGFTHCPDVCPATLQKLTVARRQIAEKMPESADEGDAALPEIVLISVDPERDTPEILEKYVEYFGDGITGVTGTVDEIRALTADLGIFFEKSGSGDNYTVNHSTAVLYVNRDAELQALFSTPLSIEAFVHDVPLLIASR